MKLTKTAIDRMRYAKEDGKQDIRWDTVVPGFGVRVYPTGRKAYVLSYRTGGRKHIMVVDQCSVKTLDQARKKAKKFLAHLDTTDPLEVKRKSAQGESVKALCEAYMERHAILSDVNYFDRFGDNYDGRLSY